MADEGAIRTVASDSEVLELDLGKCNGYGNCVLAAPGMLELDLAENTPEFLADSWTDEQRSDLAAAVADCPSGALRLRQRDSSD